MVEKDREVSLALLAQKARGVYPDSQDQKVIKDTVVSQGKMANLVSLVYRERKVKEEKV